MRLSHAMAGELLRGRRGAQVVESLCLVHGRAIVHTDVKPENVLLIDQVAARALHVLRVARWLCAHAGVAEGRGRGCLQCRCVAYNVKC